MSESEEDDEKQAEFDLDEDIPNVASDQESESDLEDKHPYPGDPGVDGTDEQYEEWFSELRNKGGPGSRMDLFRAKQLRRHRQKKSSIFDEDNSEEIVSLSEKLDQFLKS